MKASTAAGIFVIGLGAGMIASAVVISRASATVKKTYMSSEEHRLRTDLVAWLLTAPQRGYDAEHITRYYNEQTAFIDLIKRNS